MNNKIIKPTSIARAEFISSLTALINDSMLPAFILEPILKDTYFDVKVIAQKQLDEDMTKYRQALSIAENETDNHEE